MSNIVISSTENKLVELLAHFDGNVEELRWQLRCQQASNYCSEQSDFPLPLVLVIHPDGSTTREKLADLRQRGTLRWSPEDLAFNVNDPDDPNAYVLQTDDNDLLGVLDNASIPDAIRSALWKHLDAMKLAPEAETRILERLVVLNSPSPINVVSLATSTPAGHEFSLDIPPAVAAKSGSRAELVRWQDGVLNYGLYESSDTSLTIEGSAEADNCLAFFTIVGPNGLDLRRGIVGIDDGVTSLGELRRSDLERATIKFDLIPESVFAANWKASVEGYRDAVRDAKTRTLIKKSLAGPV